MINGWKRVGDRTKPGRTPLLIGLKKRTVTVYYCYIIPVKI